VQVSERISADHWLPVQASALNSALLHVGFRTPHEASLQEASLLQLGLRTSQEGLILCFVAVVLVVLVVGGVAIWFTLLEGGKTWADARDLELDKAARKIQTRYRGVRLQKTDVHGKVSTAGRLFPSHAVGTEIRVMGSVAPEPQDLIIEVNDIEGGLIARAVVCEVGEDPGILIEDSFSEPLAFIDTSLALHRTELNPWPTLTVHKLGSQEGIFGLIRHEDQGGRLVVRRPNGRLLLALHGDNDGRYLNAVNDISRLVGTVQQMDGSLKVKTLPEADAGLVICGLFAMGKIGRYGQSSGHG